MYQHTLRHYPAHYIRAPLAPRRHKIAKMDVAASLKEVSKLGYDALELALEKVESNTSVDIENFKKCLKELEKIKDKIPAKGKVVRVRVSLKPLLISGK